MPAQLRLPTAERVNAWLPEASQLPPTPTDSVAQVKAAPVHDRASMPYAQAVRSLAEQTTARQDATTRLQGLLDELEQGVVDKVSYSIMSGLRSGGSAAGK